MKLAAFLLLISLMSQAILPKDVNIYTSRHYDSDDALYEEFTKETGIKVNIISGKGSALLERIKSEGINSPADIFFTVDAGNLWKVQKEDLFQEIKSTKVISTVPENLRGPNNEWTAIEEVLENLKLLIDQGKVRHIGVSNETPWGLMKFMQVAKEKKLPLILLNARITNKSYKKWKRISFFSKSKLQ